MNQNSESRRQFLKSVSLASAVTLVQSAHTSTASAKPHIEKPNTTPTLTHQQTHLPDELNPIHFHIHNEMPLALETKRSALHSSLLTPIHQLFVRNNLPMPPRTIMEDVNSWQLELSDQKQSLTLTLQDLKQIARDQIVTVLQCSGNGRAFFDHKPSGSPWAVGAAGCVEWTGVFLSKVIEHYRLDPNQLRYLTATGGEVLPNGLDSDTIRVERSIPTRKAMKDVLLAWEMNGVPLPLTHGAPLRMVVPGYFGCNQIKYVKKIAFTAKQSTAKIQQKGYRFRPVGEKGNSNQPTMWRMPVKSWVNGPGADHVPIRMGMTQFHGVAFSGERGIQKVEYSLDDGQSWYEAQLSAIDLGKDAWRVFQFQVNLKPGTYHVVSRATDMAGDRQPKIRVNNERGYQYNAWSESALKVTVVSKLTDHMLDSHSESTSNHILQKIDHQKTSSLEYKLSESAQRGQTVFQKVQPSCGVCHQLDHAQSKGSVGPNLNALKPSQEMVIKAVSQGVGSMPSFSSTLSTQEIADLAAYVTEVTR